MIRAFIHHDKGIGTDHAAIFLCLLCVFSTFSLFPLAILFSILFLNHCDQTKTSFWPSWHLVRTECLESSQQDTECMREGLIWNHLKTNWKQYPWKQAVSLKKAYAMSLKKAAIEARLAGDLRFEEDVHFSGLKGWLWWICRWICPAEIYWPGSKLVAANGQER